MLKKSLATALLVCAVPALASASWFLTTQTSNVGGSITFNTYSTNGVVNGSPITQLADGKSPYVTKTFAAPGTAGVPSSELITFSPVSGYTLLKVVLTKQLDAGAQQTEVLFGRYYDDTTKSWVTASGTGLSVDASGNGTYSLAVQDNSTYNVTASFAANAVPVIAEFSDRNGTVTPASLGNIYYGYQLDPKGSGLTFTFAPKVGYTINDVTNIPGADAYGKTPVKTVPTGANQRATVFFPAGYIFTSAVDLRATASNSTPTLNPIAAQNAVAGSTVTITPSVLNIADPAYTFGYVSGPQNTVTFGTYTTYYPNGRKDTKVGGPDHTTVVAGPALQLINITDTNNKVTGFKFTAPNVAGQYKFLVTVNGLKKLALVNVVASASDVSNQCQFCHTANKIDDLTIGTRYQASIHGQSTHSACSACHFGGAGHPGTVNSRTVNSNSFMVNYTGVKNGSDTIASKGTVFCASCHNGKYGPAHGMPFASTANTNLNDTPCVACHASGSSSDAHDIVGTGCVGCHSVPKAAITGLVSDNNGVRAVTGEFQKWSHHVVNPNGMAVQDEQCAVCHLEGTVSGGKFAIDETKHMVDAQIHLRNAQDDSEMLWDPATPNHTTMDNFCMACHSAGGATSSIAGQLRTLISAKTGITGSATNPFCDTISNRYDKMMRPAVVDVTDQFNTNNYSHHAVRGQRYSGRTRTIGATRAISGASLTKVVGAFDANSSATLPGKRSTMFDAGNFNALYVPLGTDGTAATGLGDDSTLHCGDCHTVGQWKVGVATNAAGQLNTVAIGAHGSNNEYMLRNTMGTDDRHEQITATTATTRPHLVCFNCHVQTVYSGGKHAGEADTAGECNGDSNTLAFNGYTTGSATDGTQFAGRLSAALPTVAAFAPGYPLNGTAPTDEKPAAHNGEGTGNVFGIQCANCHNSGLSNGYGGIHGSWTNQGNVTSLDANTPVNNGYYVDGMGNLQKMERFLPGLGNMAYVPGTLGGITGGTSANAHVVPHSGSPVDFTFTTGGVANDTSWEQASYQDANKHYTGAGCYTLSETAGDITYGAEGQSVNGGRTTPEAVGTWGACADHGAPAGATSHGFSKKIIRPVSY